MKKHIRPNDENSTQRDWHDLKPGDVIWFATSWYEVLDAYPSDYDKVTIKLIVDGHFETHRVRTTNGKATCQA